MPKITFVLVDGERMDVEAATDSTVRDMAIGHLVEGIIGECGGNCSCATCHVIVDTDWFSKVGEPHQLEADLLSFLDNVTPTSRLSCQLRMTEAIDGLVVQIPPRTAD